MSSCPHSVEGGASGLPRYVYDLAKAPASFDFVAWLAVVATDYGHLPAHEQFWHLGVALAVTLAFVVTALSSEEISDILGSLEAQSNNRLSNLMQLDARLKTTQEQWQHDREDFSTKIKQMTQQLQEGEEQLNNYRRVSETVREEIEQLHRQKERFLEDLQTKTRELSALQQDLEISREQARSEHEIVPVNPAPQPSGAVSLDKLNNKLEDIILDQHDQALFHSEVEMELDMLSQDLADKEQSLEHHEAMISSMKELLAEAETKLEAESERADTLAADQGEREQHLRSQVAVKEEKLQGLHNQLLDQESKIQELIGCVEQSEAARMEKAYLLETLNQERVGRYQLELDKDSLEQQLVAQQKQSQEASTSHEKLQRLQDRIAEKESARAVACQRISTLEQELNTATQALNSAKAESSSKVHELEQALEALKASKDQTQNTPSQEVSKVESRVESSESSKEESRGDLSDEMLRKLKHAEGLYRQLRRQFDEKSEVLNKTRTELFRTESKMLAIQRKQEHDTIGSEGELAIQDLLLKLEDEHQKEQEDWLHELDTLQDLISFLVNQEESRSA